MQDDFNFRQPLKKYFCQGKVYLSKSKTQPTEIQHMLTENILLLISYT